MSLLQAHLEQISISCQGIDNLPFPTPRIFTNALLSNPDITSLIRDTESHERALFSVPPPPPPATSQNPDPPKPSSRRQTVFNVAAGEVTAGPPQNSTRSGPARRNMAVAAVLGGDLHAQIVRRGGEGRSGGGDVDIEVLLHGAEKLCAVYPLPGALERIPAQRQKYAQQSNTLAYYEAKVAEQQEALERMNAERMYDGDGDEDEDEKDENKGGVLTKEDLRREEEAVRELDKKKRELQARLRAIESDLGGLLDI
ncbi:Reticulocyte-binding protein 2 a [Madurella mycetomatis]|uniref:DASH complex subunit SPC34 n=1 Tax=Madurella mycetomatis TaxID=100816 RepID=A0A175VUT6_9PEZI|nr:Reticulocyte-binding protein 2 a [Madurella mycetomatis]KXX76382.1 Reticulocyte-binding protein 2 a [Madurella mycetomatis]